MGTIEDEMVGWHHWLDGHEFEQAQGVGDDGQGSLACCSPWGRKELDMTERLNWTELSKMIKEWNSSMVTRITKPGHELRMNGVLLYNKQTWNLKKLGCLTETSMYGMLQFLIKTENTVHGQGSQVYWGPWDCKELDTPEQLNWTDWTECSKVTFSV